MNDVNNSEVSVIISSEVGVSNIEEEMSEDVECIENK